MVSFTILIALIALMPSAKCLVWNYCDNRFDVEIYQNDLTEVQLIYKWPILSDLISLNLKADKSRKPSSMGFGSEPFATNERQSAHKRHSNPLRWLISRSRSMHANKR